MSGPDRASRQYNLTGSYEACHEHRCPTSQPARVRTYRRCVLHNNMAPRHRRDAACRVSTQRLCNRTRPCNCTTTMSPDYESSFEGGQPCERVQRSKAGGCLQRSALPLRSKYATSLSGTASNTGQPTRKHVLPINIMPGPDRASRQHNLQD